MATYKVSELAGVIRELIRQDYDYVEIFADEADEEFPASLDFSGIHDYCAAEGIAEVEATEIPVDYIRGYSIPQLNADDISNGLCFSFEELCTLMNAVDNALEYGKERLASSDCTKEERDIIKSTSPALRNMQAKFAKFRKKYCV